jgi:minor extracellular serine protease Vpr
VSNPAVSRGFVPVVTLSGHYGAYLKTKLTTTRNQIVISSTKRERIVDFSSRGPVVTTWAIKPDVTAPGVDILSTIPTSISYSGYVKESGTSMAAPHVAGAVALIKQSHPTWTPQEIKSALANTAVSLLDSERKISPAIEQGSGRVDIYRAIHTETLALPNNFSFGLFSYNSGTKQVSKTLQIKNMSSSVKNYTVRVKLDRAVTGFQVSTPTTLQVQPGSATNLTATLSLNTALAKGDYSGTILISDGVQEIKVPFITFISPEDVPTP